MITINARLQQKLETYPLVLQLQSPDDQTFLSNQSQKSTHYQNQLQNDTRRRLSLLQIKIHKVPIYIFMVVGLLLFLHFFRKIKTDSPQQGSISKINQPPQSQSQQNHSINSNIFQIQHNFWIFDSDVSNQTYLAQLIIQNQHRYAQISNFTVHAINEDNFHHHISKRRAQELTSLIKELKNKANDTNQKSNLKQHLPKIIKTVILLNVLAENGGIMITDTFVFTEDFSWIKHINDNIYVNRGNHDAFPEVVGFYTPAYSFPQAKQNKKHQPGMEEVDKYMTIFPTVESYFLAAKKQSDFIIAMIYEINDIFLDSWQIQNQIAHNLYTLNNFAGKDIYYEYFMLAAQKVLQTKQKQLDQDNYRYRHRRFAIDQYGLFVINCFYGPLKLKHFWQDRNQQKIIQNLAQYDLKELEASVGPLRYISFLSPEKQLDIFLTDAMNNKNQGLLNGSFLHKMLCPYQSSTAVHSNKEKSMVDQNSEPWHSLPRTIWVYWDKGLKNSNISNQLFVQNLNKTAKKSNFSLIEVNDTNIGDYLQESMLQRINTALTQAKVRIYRPTKSDLYRLALIATHGGIYFDSSYIALSNFKWLVNIGKYPSQYIFNRYGNLPKVFMLFHPHFGGPFEWTVSQQYNTKANWHLAYENNLIIAQKGAQLIQQWLDLFLQLLQTPYQQISHIFQSYGLSYHKWTNQRNQYLLAMDSIKCVIGRRQKQLFDTKQLRYADASDYYKIWSMSGCLGQQKLRFNTNYANYAEGGNNNNVFLTRYPQQYVEGLLGEIKHFTKFYHYHNMEISNFVLQNSNNFSRQTHSQSIFMKYIYDETKAIHQDDDKSKM